VTQVFCESQKTIMLTYDLRYGGSITLRKDIVGINEAVFCIKEVRYD
jgi:hypothetical protein